jgi:hypothetical protein
MSVSHNGQGSLQSLNGNAGEWHRATFEATETGDYWIGIGGDPTDPIKDPGHQTSGVIYGHYLMLDHFFVT